MSRARELTSTQTHYTKILKRNSFEKHYAYKIDTLAEMDNSLERHKSLKLTQEEMLK